MTNQFFARIKKELDRRKDENLLRQLKVYDSYRLNLSSNDYLQMRTHPDVISASAVATKKFGAGSGASPLLSGYLPCHQDLLNKLTLWKRKSTGMIFNSGFMANQALLKQLPGPKDIVLADKLVHHSIIQALDNKRARYKRYRHLDMDHLEQLLNEHHADHETVFVVTESVFSMDGDYPDLVRLTALKTKYPFILILDEAHGTGIFGPTGGGLAEEQNVHDKVDILVGTFGKALGGMGAYVLTDNSSIVNYLINTAGEFIYSTFLSPAQAGAAEAAIGIVQGLDEDRKNIRANAVWFRSELQKAGWETNNFDSQIVPLILGQAKMIESLSRFLGEKGILVSAIRPPTVAKDSSRLRFSIHSGITRQNLNEILELLNQWRKD